jgi:hypothetical protein
MGAGNVPVCGQLLLAWRPSVNVFQAIWIGHPRLGTFPQR